MKTIQWGIGGGIGRTGIGGTFDIVVERGQHRRDPPSHVLIGRTGRTTTETASVTRRNEDSDSVRVLTQGRSREEITRTL